MNAFGVGVRRHFVCGALLALFGVGASAEGLGKAIVFKQLGDLEVCVRQLRDADDCLAGVKEYLRKHPKEDLAAARLVRLNFRSHVALAFFEGPIKRHGKSVCADEDLSLAVRAGLALPADYPDAARARKIFAEQCRAELAPAVAKEVAEEKGKSYLKDNACPILQNHGAAPDSCRAEPEAKPVAAAPETLPKLDKGKVSLEAGKAYAGSEGEKVVMIPLQGSDHYLLHFSGLRGPWNGKTILHRREERGNGAANFWTEYKGARWNTVVQRGWIEVHVPEYKPGNGFPVSYSETETKAISTQAVLDGWTP